MTVYSLSGAANKPDEPRSLIAQRYDRPHQSVVLLRFVNGTFFQTAIERPLAS